MGRGRNNHDKAWHYFIALGLIPLDAKKGEWCLHHKDPTLRTRDPDRYHEWRFEDLVPMTKSYHNTVHNKGKKMSEATRKKLSEACKRAWQDPEFKAEMSKKISEANKRVWQDPEYKERMTEVRRKQGAEVKAKNALKPKPPKIEKPKLPRKTAWINDGVKNARIAPSDVIPNGWQLGRIGGWNWNSNVEHIRGKMSDEHKSKIGKWKAGKIWATNGEKIIMCDKNNIPEGFKPGRKK